jgi:hypothetical protein
MSGVYDDHLKAGVSGNGTITESSIRILPPSEKTKSIVTAPKLLGSLSPTSPLYNKNTSQGRKSIVPDKGSSSSSSSSSSKYHVVSPAKNITIEFHQTKDENLTSKQHQRFHQVDFDHLEEYKDSRSAFSIYNFKNMKEGGKHGQPNFKVFALEPKTEKELKLHNEKRAAEELERQKRALQDSPSFVPPPRTPRSAMNRTGVGRMFSDPTSPKELGERRRSSSFNQEEQKGGSGSERRRSVSNASSSNGITERGRSLSNVSSNDRSRSLSNASRKDHIEMAAAAVLAVQQNTNHHEPLTPKRNGSMTPRTNVRTPLVNTFFTSPHPAPVQEDILDKFKKCSYWHSIPLAACDSVSGVPTGSFHFVCEMPKYTTVKLEVDTQCEYNPVVTEASKGKTQHLSRYTGGCWCLLCVCARFCLSVGCW